MERGKYDRKISLGRVTAKTQSASGPATQQWVSVAVLPAKLASPSYPFDVIAEPMAALTQQPMNKRASNASSLSSVSEQGGASGNPGSRRKSVFDKMKLKQKEYAPSNPDRPPYVMKQVPYDTWRKHYAKDKDGNYHGTRAPAEDCLLKPEDIKKWRLGEAMSTADLYTRGSHALPTYDEVQEEGGVPEYTPDVDPESAPNLVDYNPIPNVEPVWTENEDRVASKLEREDSRYQRRQGDGGE